MAVLAIAAAGAWAGAATFGAGAVLWGMSGAQLGWMAGSMLGNAMFSTTQKSEGPRLGDLTVSGSAYGATIPWVAGHPRVAGQIVWASAKREIATTQSAGGKGGGGSEYTSYTYEVDLLILLSDNQIGGVRRIWKDGELVFSAADDASAETLEASATSTLWSRLTSYSGASDQLPDPDYSAAVGIANAPAYRGRGAVFIKSLQLGGGGNIPNLTFELTPSSSTPLVITLIDYINEAKYLTKTNALAGDYSGVDFDDSGWLTGLFPTGNSPKFGGPEPRSRLFYNGDTCWVRDRFRASAGGTVTIHIIVDDTALIYINGEMVFDCSYSSVWAYSFPSSGESDYLLAIKFSGTNIGIEYAAYSVTVSFASYAATNATLQDTVSDICLLSGLSESQFDVTALSSITRPVRAFANSSVSSARTVLDLLAGCYQFEAVLADKLYFKPRGSSPVTTITFDEFGVMVDSTNPPDPLPLTQANELEIPAQLALTYVNVDSDYQTDTQYSDRLLTGMESTSATQVPLGFTADEAKQIADCTLLDKAVSALSTTITLDTSRAALQPTDVILLTGDDASTYRMRIVKRTDSGGVTTLACVADDASVLAQSGATSGGTASQTTVAALATTSLELMDIPLLRDADNTPGHYVAVKGSNASWTNCALYDSPDNVTFTQNTIISGGAVMGSCTTTLGNWTGGNFADEANTLTVSVGDGQLYSATHEGMLSNTATNAALVGGEIIQFREAALVSAGVYTLRGLLRGRRGTEAAMAGHASGERFVLLSSSGLRFVSHATSDLGRTIYYKAASASQKLSAVTSQNLTFQSQNLKPFRPVNQRVNTENGDTVISWDRRTRVAENWLLGSVPLGESVEAWEIDVLSGSTRKRTLTSATASVTYTNAQRYADFGGAAATVEFAVYQVSAYVGRGDGVTTSASVPVTTPPADLSNLIATDKIYPVCKAGSAFVATKMLLSGSAAVHQLFESTNGGATLGLVSGASVFLSKRMAAARSDGVYVSLPWCPVPNSNLKEFEAFSRSGEISIMRGVAGSVPRYAVTALPLGNDPVGIGCNGTSFYILMEGNHIWKSTDGDTWTDTGAASGLPYTLSSSYSGNLASRNYTYTSNLHWTGAAWLLGLSGKLYRTTDADALTGWTEVAWAGLYYYGPDKFVQTGSVIIAALYSFSNPSNMRFERSTDNGATWAVVWERNSISPAALPTHLTLAAPIAIDGEFVASTSNGEYRRIYSTASGTSWTVGSNDPTAGWSTYCDQISDGSNTLGYSRDETHGFIYSTDGVTYASSTIP